MITVFGANGNTGSVIANKLLDSGQRVRAVARSADKLADLAKRGAEVLAGDVTDAAFVAKALAGASAAYLLSPPDLTSPDLIARGKKIFDNYGAALAAHRVARAVVLSSVGAQLPSGTGPIAMLHYAEQALPAAAPATKFTFVRAAYFMENVLGNAHPMKHDGVLPVFGGGESYPFPMVATRDIGEVAAAELLRTPPANDWIELVGPKDYSLADAAAEATSILGRKVTAVALPIEQMVPTLTSFGFSANVASLFREMTEAFGRGLGFDGKGRRVLGKVTLAEVLRGGLR